MLVDVTGKSARAPTGTTNPSGTSTIGLPADDWCSLLCAQPADATRFTLLRRSASLARLQHLDGGRPTLLVKPGLTNGLKISCFRHVQLRQLLTEGIPER